MPTYRWTCASIRFWLPAVVGELKPKKVHLRRNINKLGRYVYPHQRTLLGQEGAEAIWETRDCGKEGKKGPTQLAQVCRVKKHANRVKISEYSPKGSAQVNTFTPES